ncbi:HNH endonuclease [Vibrio fluvialis]|nr:HNH endonuclease [Vibrio fluvialis]
MKYWWVSQNQTYKQEFEGGYLWSPKVKKDGNSSHAYDSMTRICAGDVLFSFKSTRIPSIGIAQSDAYSHAKPPEITKETWNDDGWKVDVEYTKLNNAIRPKDHIDTLRQFLPNKYSPLKQNGDGNESYLFELPQSLAEELLILIGKESETAIDSLSSPELTDGDDQEETDILQSDDLSITEKRQLIKSRRGQGIFRKRLEAIEPCCRVTKINSMQHLIASHIKPWRYSSNVEKLDGNNGLLLAPHIDHLFDKGYITFQDNGDFVSSKQLSSDVLERLAIHCENVGMFKKEQCVYLKYHRENVFKK